MHRLARLGRSSQPCSCAFRPQYQSGRRLYASEAFSRDSRLPGSSARSSSQNDQPRNGPNTASISNNSNSKSPQHPNRNSVRHGSPQSPSQNRTPSISNNRSSGPKRTRSSSASFFDGIGETNSSLPKNNRGRAKDSGRRSQSSLQDSTVKSNRPSSASNRQISRSKTPNPQKSDTIAVEIPTVCSVNTLIGLLKVKLPSLQRTMIRLGLQDTRPDAILQSEDATLIALEFGRKPIVDDTAALDLFAAPPHPDPSSLPLRPPIVTIMGHVDHGKTTLLDKLRSTSVATGESGGITQHIGAFTVPLKSSTSSVTFLDTPGHAAFSSMRARGAQVTDIVVLVVAADDGVKSQTREVIKLLQDSNITNIVVALTKCDKSGVNKEDAKSKLAEEGIHIEEFGGDVPLVEVSGKTGDGLNELVETLSTVAEVMDIRASPNAPIEGVVVESRKELGKGSVATMLVKNGTLTLGRILVSGVVSCRVRTLEPTVMTQDMKLNKIKEILPGIPAQITGWSELPNAGDEILEAKDIKEANTVINNRKRKESRDAMVKDVGIINEKRKIEAEEQAKQVKVYNRRTKTLTREKREEDVEVDSDSIDNQVKVLNLIVKGDVSGSVEAVEDALLLIGNSQAKVKVIQTGVGPIGQSDVQTADTLNATVVGFNVPTDKKAKALAEQYDIPLVSSPIIYRIVEKITESVTDLLPQKYEDKVDAEAKVQAIFEIDVKGNKNRVVVAGSRVVNGTLKKKSKVRVIRKEEIIHQGYLASLKHVKDEVDEIKNGTECGLSITDFDDIRVGDTIEAYENIPTPKQL